MDIFIQFLCVVIGILIGLVLATALVRGGKDDFDDLA